MLHNHASNTKAADSGLAAQSLDSLCARLCNLTWACDKLVRLNAQLHSQWRKLRGQVRSVLLRLSGSMCACALMRCSLATTRWCSRSRVATAFRVESVSALISCVHSWSQHCCVADLLGDASAMLLEQSNKLSDLIATRVVYVNWKTPLLGSPLHPFSQSLPCSWCLKCSQPVQSIAPKLPRGQREAAGGHRHNHVAFVGPFLPFLAGRCQWCDVVCFDCWQVQARCGELLLAPGHVRVPVPAGRWACFCFCCFCSVAPIRGERCVGRGSEQRSSG